MMRHYNIGPPSISCSINKMKKKTSPQYELEFTHHPAQCFKYLKETKIIPKTKDDKMMQQTKHITYDYVLTTREISKRHLPEQKHFRYARLNVEDMSFTFIPHDYYSNASARKTKALKKIKVPLRKWIIQC